MVSPLDPSSILLKQSCPLIVKPSCYIGLAMSARAAQTISLNLASTFQSARQEDAQIYIESRTQPDCVVSDTFVPRQHFVTNPVTPAYQPHVENATAGAALKLNHLLLRQCCAAHCRARLIRADLLSGRTNLVADVKSGRGQ
jgi:hypothetical protein